jgi:hypothetical protein
MLPLKLKVYAMEGDRKIENFNEEQWKEVCIIFQKLVRNIKEEIKSLEIDNFCTDEICHITMDLSFKDEEEITEEKMSYIGRYLSGEETDNPVYFNEEDPPVNAESIIILEDESESLLDRFNKMVLEINDN